jgi:hypothetical protein
VQRLGGTQFRVAGNVEKVYHVDLSAEIPCYCLDMEYRAGEIRQQCKHVLASRLAQLDPALLGIIADWFTTEERQTL